MSGSRQWEDQVTGWGIKVGVHEGRGGEIERRLGERGEEPGRG